MSRLRPALKHWCSLALAALVLLLAPAARAAPELPPLPSGYSADPEGPVRWVYPTAAASEVESLKERLPEAWGALSDSLGAPLPPELDIRIGINFEDMQSLAPKGTRLPGYAAGVALSRQGLILLTLTDPRSFRRPDLESVFVHELSHVALHRALEGNEVPRWFNEGVAIHHAEEHSLARIRTLWDGTLRGDLIPLAKLDRGFPRHHGDVDLAYAQSADVVGYLLEPAGGGGFHRLVARLRAGTPFEKAVEEAYGRPLADLEREWRAALDRRYGRWPSLLIGLTTVWALAAMLLVVGYLRLRRHHHRTLAQWAREEATLEAEPGTIKLTVAETPRRTPADAAFDAIEARRRRDPDVPTVEHDGQSHTLH